MDNFTETLALAAANDSKCTNLDVPAAYASVDEFGALAAALKANTHVSTLYLQGTVFTVAHMKHLIDALAYSTGITNLDMSRVTIDTECMALLAEQLAESTDLKYVDIHSKSLASAACMQQLASGLAANNSITRLSLCDCGIDDEGAEHVAAMIAQNTTLVDVALASNKIGPEGAHHMAEALKTNTTLQYIDLQKNPIGDDGMGAMAAALSVNTGLKCVDLTCKGVTTDALLVLAKAVESNKRIKTCHVHNDGVWGYGKGYNKVTVAARINQENANAAFEASRAAAAEPKCDVERVREHEHA